MKTRRLKGAIPATVDTNTQTSDYHLSFFIVWQACTMMCTPRQEHVISPPAMLTFAFVKADYGF